MLHISKNIYEKLNDDSLSIEEFVHYIITNYQHNYKLIESNDHPDKYQGFLIAFTENYTVHPIKCYSTKPKITPELALNAHNILFNIILSTIIKEVDVYIHDVDIEDQKVLKNKHPNIFKRLLGYEYWSFNSVIHVGFTKPKTSSEISLKFCI